MAATPFTELHLAVMQILWSGGETTAREMMANLDRPLARPRMLRLLNHLEKQGIVTRRAAGRSHVYRAALDPAEARKSFVENVASLADGLFEGGVAELVCQLVQARDVNPEDLGRVIPLLEAREREQNGGTE